MVLLARSNTTKEIEILVPRHQLAVLERRTPWPHRSLGQAAPLRPFPVHPDPHPSKLENGQTGGNRQRQTRETPAVCCLPSKGLNTPTRRDTGVLGRRELGTGDHR